MLALIIGLIFAVYAALGHDASGSDGLLLPLDDTYIHFQYARMTAQGVFFRYNALDPATSGATSLIYPFLLAVGYKLGFTGTLLALWAIGIGGIAWFVAAGLVYRLLLVMNPERYMLAFILTLAFALSGGLAWAALSGMETALIVCLTLYTLDRAVRHDLRGVIIGGMLCAITRPEGAIVALCAALYVLFQMGAHVGAPLQQPFFVGAHPRVRPALLFRSLRALSIIILAILIQPGVNVLLTGTFTASGMQAKSVLYNVPFDWGTALTAILNNFARAWLELLTGLDIDRVLYFIPGLLLIGLIGCLFTKARRPALLLWIVIIGNFAALSILETAFWQFKRYQQPVIALAFVALGWWLCTLRWRRLAFLIGGITLAVSLVTCATFAVYYQNNVREIASLQVPMARYVNSITTPNDQIVVHDIGVMAYIGDRRVYDVVGLATNGAALAWRTGPGAMYEQLRASTDRPNYVAIYDEPHGLSYFKNTPLFRDTLRAFPSTGLPHLVASASANQIVAKIDWTNANAANQTYQPVPDGFRLVDQLNVADLESERAHQYQFTPADLTGFASEAFYQPTLNTELRFMDSGRRLSSEKFTIRVNRKQAMIWKMRVQPRAAASIQLHIDGRAVQTVAQPGDLGGHWLEITAFIPAGYVESETPVLEARGIAGAAYQPYYHWFYQSEQPYQPNTRVTLPLLDVKFWDEIWLKGARATRNGNQLIVETEWERGTNPTPRFDAKTFVHVYKDIDQPPVAQFDTRAGNGALPPANWLPGIIRERYVLTLPSATEQYKLAIGLYNPETNQRYPIVQNGSGNRLFIEIK